VTGERPAPVAPRGLLVLARAARNQVAARRERAVAEARAVGHRGGELEQEQRRARSAVDDFDLLVPTERVAVALRAREQRVADLRGDLQRRGVAAQPGARQDRSAAAGVADVGRRSTLAPPRVRPGAATLVP